jgi:mono/diheme cytochrome c family protein
VRKIRFALNRREGVQLLGILAVLFVVIQFLPVGAPHSNPPVLSEPAWNAPRTRVLFFRACANCHSNETRWPWYSRVAPVSWLVAHDVAEGRHHLDVSEWNRPQRDARNAANQVRRGEMPLEIYAPLHPEARLTPEEKQALIDGLVATFGDRQRREARGEQ